MKVALLALLSAGWCSMTAAYDTPDVLETAASTVDLLAESIGDVPAKRRELLDKGAEFVAAKLHNGETANLTFICTHNSRRSQLAQVWAKVAADYYGLEHVESYSGGTEVTACNLRSVQALRRAGLQVVSANLESNPRYLLQYANNREPLELFSKLYDSKDNPQTGYAAMMCCADADERCPVVRGAEVSVPLHYLDPKVADDTPEESAAYDERNRQIGGEMFYMMAKAARILGRK